MKNNLKQGKKRMVYQLGFFDIEDAYARIDARNPLKKIEESVDWSGLKELMGKIKFDADNNGGKGGRKPLDGLVMAKIFILQSLYNLSDEAAEFMIEDRLSFKKFLKIPLNKKAPDAKTIWVWRERVKAMNLEEAIFAWFMQETVKAGYVAKEGEIGDATFVPTHTPTNKHKKQLEEGEPLTVSQERQKDQDAAFTKKGGVSYHGYKNHVCIDTKNKLIQSFGVTPASVHDSQVFEELLSSVEADEGKDEKDKGVWADSAYRSQDLEVMIENKDLKSRVCERAYRNKPLTAEQKASNKEKSKIRARVEHVFGIMNNSMGGLMIHTLGLSRAKFKMTFKNLAYNIWRFSFLQTLHKRQETCA